MHKEPVQAALQHHALQKELQASQTLECAAGPVEASLRTPYPYTLHLKYGRFQARGRAVLRCNRLTERTSGGHLQEIPGLCCLRRQVPVLQPEYYLERATRKGEEPAEVAVTHPGSTLGGGRGKAQGVSRPAPPTNAPKPPEAANEFGPTRQLVEAIAGLSQPTAVANELLH